MAAAEASEDLGTCQLGHEVASEPADGAEGRGTCILRPWATFVPVAVADHPHPIAHVERILEKPAISKAELELITPGLRTGHYLCFFGIHVLTPAIFDILESHMSGAADYALTPALNELARRERYLAHEVKGVRYDLGQKFGLLRAQLALGIAGERQDEVLASVLEVMIEARECAAGRPEKDS